MRGENQMIGDLGDTPGGTSPRARGKPGNPLCFHNFFRNIPACAGKTRPCSIMGKSWSEHPRVRGENQDVDDCDWGLCGTSPRARGKQVQAVATTGKIRNIPACAGKTYTCSGVWFSAAEHPRVRGENSAGQSGHSQSRGTSPRARGKQNCVVQTTLRRGNIPACAGKTR